MSEPGRIVAEYDNFSVWSSKMPNATSFTLPNAGASYHICYSYLVPVSTYEDALLEPEWDVFI